MARIANGSIIDGSNITEGIRTTNEGNPIDPNGKDEPVTITDTGTIIAGYDAIDPGSATESTDSGTSGPKRRGRPPGSKNATRTTTTKEKDQDLSNLEGILLSIHFTLAGITSTPELALDPKEANMLAGAMQRVANQYPIHINPKLMAWLNLSLVAGGIYGTRIVTIIKKQPEKPKLLVMQPTASNVSDKASESSLPPSKSDSSKGRITNPSQLFGPGFNGDIQEAF